ncbi:MAG TPA: ferritin-like domain-containing protein [Candidatus Eisenbacteria bacterium]|jgi:ferritin-like metal-binding protein YciE|nr:ferritin-like domain-containing protein [Candidatus Eisenbacteria bacterium]
MLMDSFDKLYLDQLKDAYNAEKQLVKAIPKMVKAATSPELRTALEDHLEVTRRQVERLEEIFQDMGKPASGKTCKGMSGIIDEGSEILHEDGDPAVIDAGIIAAAQRAEHYEIASYGTLKTFARTKGDTKAARILEEILNEEKEADRRLTQIAETSVNSEARDIEEEEWDEDEDEGAGRDPGEAQPRRGLSARDSGRRGKSNTPWT